MIEANNRMIETFDAKQSQAIRCKRNAVVMAGAGSGKTAVIAERYCRLLQSDDIGVDQILTLTFTQKAAAEMYERIHNRLLHGHEALRRHLESFEQAQISTLDSFCAEILTNACDRFGLPEDFLYDEQAVGRVAEQTSLEFLLEKLECASVQRLMHIHGFETLWKQLFTDLACNHLHLPGPVDYQSMFSAQVERCLLDLEAETEVVSRTAGQIAQLDPRTASIERTQAILSDIPNIRELLEAKRYAEAADRISALRVNKPGGRGAADIQMLKDLIDRLRPSLKNLGTLAATLSRESLLREVFSLLEEFAERFLERKRSLGLVSFQDVARLAVEALIRDKALRHFYKNRYRYIMIDEFQDNNRLQKELLFLLAERIGTSSDGVPSVCDLEAEKLFFVGDEKQSIYRFRGAEVGVFKTLHEQLRSAGGRTIALDRNYRSESSLIEFVNRVFSVVMAEAEAEYEARYQKMHRGGDDGDVDAHIILLYGDQEQTPEADYAPANLAEAYAVVRFIREAVEQQSLRVFGPEGNRPVGYDDFAVLLRSTGNQIHYERMFRHFAVPYSTDNLRSLFTEAPINDFYLLLQLAVYPEDTAAYAGVLRSPFVNCSDETVIRLLLNRAAGQQTELFSDTEAALSTSQEDRRRILRAARLYAWLCESVDRLSIAEIFHNLWYRYGYRYTILRNPGDHNYLEYFDYMIKLAERADRQGDSLAIFLDFLRRNLGKYERLDDLTVLGPRRPGVQLLTIHRSKGLEFPVVVLADMGNMGRARGVGPKPYYLSAQYGITINFGPGNYFTEIGEKEAQQEELAEIKRLMYVALTRAQCHLVLAGTHKQKNRSGLRAHLNLLFHGLGWEAGTPSAQTAPNVPELRRIEALSWEQLSQEARPAERRDLKRMQPLYAGSPCERSVPRREISVTELCTHLTALLQRQEGREPTAVKARRLPGMAIDPVLKDANLESRFGTLTHQLLARWADNPAASPPEPDWGRSGIPEALREPMFESAVKLCRAFFDSKLGILSSEAEHVQREFPFLYLFEDRHGPLYISGQIDLMFERDHHLYLVDFKTDRSYKPGEHDCQLALYRLALRELTRKRIEAFIFLLRSGQAVRSAAREEASAGPPADDSAYDSAADGTPRSEEEAAAMISAVRPQL